MIVVVMLTGSLLSLVMNNIAAAAVLLPAVTAAGRRARVSPARLLMPLAFSTLLGGMATLLTTANIVSSSLLQDHGLSGFGLLDFLPLGLPIIVCGTAYVALLGRRRLPAQAPQDSLQVSAGGDLVEIYRLGERLFRARVPTGSYLIGRPVESWTELLNPEFKGKASILDISSIGIMDAAMVCESMGEIKYGDKGNMTRDEIDKTMAIMIEAKKNGQFRAFWKSFDESVNLMASGEVVIQSMWSPAITAVRSKGIPCVYQPLVEGYRSWGGGIGLSKNLSGLELEAAYEYINWYLDGWVGGFLMRQGYYSAVPETSKNYMSANEWGFWFEGKPATEDIVNPFGQVMEKAGATRDGGSFYERMGQVACWNAVMDENQYMVRKWNEFIAA